MSLFPSAFVESPPTGTAWPAPLMGPGGEALRRRVELATSVMPKAIAAVIGELLVDDQALAGRATLQALCLAGAAGAIPLEPIDPQMVLLQRPDGQRFVLGTLPFAMPAAPLGPPDAVRALTEALNGAFGQERRYMLYIRRPVPPDFDPEPVRRAVHLWLVAIGRGEWAGRHAVYEDDDMAIELTLLDSGPGSGLAMMVGPTNSLERMATVDARLIDLISRHERLAPEYPLLAILASDTRWRMPRGYVEQLLYGTADWVSAGGGTYAAAFQSTGLSLFSDPTCRRLAALWWIEPQGPDPLGFQAWAHENPWCEEGGIVPALDGRRFTLAGPLDLDTPRSGDSSQIVLTWLGDEPVRWGP